ncbi:MAG: hypothetical protein PHE51_06620 [Eubacteriales bacterium]|nr:hypothetical protein [Eubacteriales bacterium]
MDVAIENYYEDLGGILVNRKFIVSSLILVVILFSGCASEKTVSQDVQKPPLEQIEELYNTIVASADSSKIRDGLNKLDTIVNDTTITAEEQKTAKLALNFCTGIAKLSMYDNGVSAFDFPEISYLQTSIIGITTQKDFTPLDEALRISEAFLAKVNDYVK